MENIETRASRQEEISEITDMALDKVAEILKSKFIYKKGEPALNRNRSMEGSIDLMRAYADYKLTLMQNEKASRTQLFEKKRLVSKKQQEVKMLFGQHKGSHKEDTGKDICAAIDEAIAAKLESTQDPRLTIHSLQDNTGRQR